MATAATVESLCNETISAESLARISLLRNLYGLEAALPQVQQAAIQSTVSLADLLNGVWKASCIDRDQLNPNEIESEQGSSTGSLETLAAAAAAVLVDDCTDASSKREDTSSGRTGSISKFKCYIRIVVRFEV